MKGCAFTKADRIRTSAEYRALSRYGARQHSDFFIIVYRKNQFSRSRLGITVSKKVGKAVTRNRIKRLIREFFRSNRSFLPISLDVNVIVRQPSGKSGTAVLRDKLRCCLVELAQKIKKRYDDQAGTTIN